MPLNKYLFLFVFISINVTANDSPIGSDYPVKLLDTRKITKRVDVSDSFTKEYRTQFKNALTHPISFAGEYATATWGCGSAGCTTTAYINLRTGKALSQIFTNYETENQEDDPIGELITFSDKNSRLLITYETREELVNGERLHFSNYYLLESNQLKLIKKLPVK
jgi:hypothetical protein